MSTNQTPQFLGHDASDLIDEILDSVCTNSDYTDATVREFVEDIENRLRIFREGMK